MRQVEKLSATYPERISNSYLAYCETGRLLPSLGKLITLSKVLGVPLRSFTERIELDREAPAAPRAAGEDGWREIRLAGIAEAEAGRLAMALSCFEKAAESLPAGTDAGTRADLVMDMAIVLKRMSRHHMVRDLLEELVSDRRLDGARIDRCLIVLGDTLREMGRPTIAVMVAREALDRAVRAGDPAKEATAASLLANALFDVGGLEEALPLYERSVAIFRRAGAPAPLTCNVANLGNCLNGLDRFTEGARLLKEAEALARAHGYSRHLADVLSYQAIAWRRQGQVARAEKHFYQSNQLARSGEFHDILFGNIWHLYEMARAQGRLAEAADHQRTLRCLRSKVQNLSPETRAYDRLNDAALSEEGSTPDGRAS